MLEDLPARAAKVEVDYDGRGVTLEHETFRFELDRVGLMAVIDVGRNEVAGHAVVGVDGRAVCSNATAERVIGAWLSHCSTHGLEPWRRSRG